MSKRKGTRAEHKTMQRLESVGYTTMRAPASLGVWDVIAWRGDAPGLRAIQVKCNRPPGPAEREAMELADLPQDSMREYWVWKDYAREPVIVTLVGRR